MAQANDEELTRLQQKVIDEFRELGRVTPETAKALHDAQTEISNFNFKVELGTKFLGKMGDAVSNTTKAMYRGEKGAAAFNQSVGDMADAAQIAAVGLSLLIPGGPIMKAVVAGLTYLGTSALKAGSELVQTANKQSDSLYSAFQKMSKSGASASDGLTGIFGDIQKLGLGIQDLDGYVNMINDSSRDLAMFRGNVADGRRAFADMNQQMKPFTQQLYNAGLSQEDITHGAMGYLKIQTQIGRAQTMTTEQLAQGAKKYLIEQDALTKLTGQSRQEAEATRAKAESEQRFRAVVESMRRSGDEKQIKAAQELVNANQVLSSQSEEAGQGFRDLTTGMITTDAGLKAYNSSNGEALRIATEMKAGNIDAINGVQDMAKAFGANADSLNSMAQAGVYEDYGIKFADSVKLGNLAMNDLTEMFKKVVAEQEKQGVTGKKALDDLQQTQTEIRLLQKDTMLLTQAFVQQGVGPATDAMKKLAEAANAAATALLAETKSKKILEPGTVTTTEQQKDIAKTSSGTGGAVVEGAIVGGFGGEGDAGAIMAAAMEPPSAAAVPNAVKPAGGGGTAPVKPAGGGGKKPSGGGGSAPPAAPTESKGSAAPDAPTEAGVQMGDEVKIGKQIRKGGSVSWRTNNPGNVSYSGLSKKYGAIGTWKNPNGDPQQRSTGIAIFPTMEDGEALKMAQWQRPMYIDKTIDQGAMQWAEGAKKEGPGSGYATALAKAAGATLDTVLGTLTNQQLKSMVAKQNQLEGFKEGQVVSAADGGMFSGPKSGYPATLHGPEAVIPIKNGSVPVTINSTGLMDLMPSLEIDSDTADQISESVKTGMNTNFGAMVNSLNELVRQQQDQNSLGLQERMIALLEDIRSSQVSTADHTGRMAAVASN